ncbi:hypothetical protein [Streptomyces sp. NBC_01358]|uniref:hypothetical protein n=1 Tax=Streptomyces sp. NBC_01358 TaxID=2903837 RepID=UPI002E30D463|nr:hypothetical protein [Streptomyces sp. NBC_01358]
MFGDEKFTPPWSTMDVGSDHVEAAGALAVSLYLLARERSVAPADITVQELDELVGAEPGTGMLRARLVALGHALDDDDDPVMVRWRALDYVHEEPAYGDLDDSSLRAGHAAENGLRHALAPFYRERIHF